jgi:tetratricopeptide (TPR) repeat protein
MVRSLGHTAACVLTILLAGCSARGIAVNALANAMSASGDGFATEDDPELVRDAAPFALKTMESLLAERPDHQGLLLALTAGFTQYGYAFIETEAIPLQDREPREYRRRMDRALRMYLRARDYGLRLLELRQPGLTEGLRSIPDSAVTVLEAEDVPAMYWTAAAWGAAIGAGLDDPALVADFPAVRALFRRGLALDPDFEDGALHEAMIALESVSPLMGGSAERAREHFERAVELADGQKAGPYVSLAGGLVVAEQDRREFERLLEMALAVDPDAAPRLRLANLIAQRRARYLLDRADYLFYEDTKTPDPESPR